MIKFLIKGMLRDRHRSLFPIIIVSFGVMLTTVIYSYINGEIDDLIDSNARYDTGHLKVITRAYNEFANQMPNDLALTEIEELTNSLRQKYSDYEWVPRIRFVGLLDVPDQSGETKSQTTIFGLGINIFNNNSNEIERLRLNDAIVNGKLPSKSREILIGNQLAKIIGLQIGNSFTLLSTSANGSMAVENFTLCGTVEFGIAGMDRGIIIADLSDIQNTLDMSDAASEILGFCKNRFYHPDQAEEIKNNFNSLFKNSNDKFSPMIITLGEQNGLGEWLFYVHSIGLLIVGVFLIAMSVVLLNTGLMSGIRRYGEIGVRLAMGESKGRIYKSMLYESFFIGTIGSLLGTVLGLLIVYYLQEVGIDISGTLRNSSIMMPTILRAKVSTISFIIGFIPGLIATIIGTAFSGIQIYKRQTASLFKELEA